MATRDENPGRWYHRGQGLCTTSCFNEAVVCYDKALELSPDDPVLWRRRGFALIRAGRYEEAVASFDRALALDPEDATAWQRKGYVLAHLGEHDSAVACCDRALMLDPEHILAWQSRGWVLGAMCRYDEAAECYEAVLSIDPERGSAAWHRDRMRERRDIEALVSEIREAGRVIEVPACIRDVARERDYGNVDLARAVLRELARRVERAAVPRR
ncbi:MULTISPECIES: tetratricopeptide repeat protein [Methanoculleus]|uniref:TPR repeat-containing protein n=2 Tax=Methanoculleus TaxID=45989 RepID=A3CWJ9_METMJ|nr:MULTISPECIES: tetratricopeptide repeat protein [Methanoculleus]ABN57749.1 TPR repeat-containing protein [Methanoculleus marisnigri JR1]MCC7556760.1 tetratricopeptide repeat protein [Methanoculleus marisnigri]UYU19140.1 tetratricopeptide repeat protein [Methanoculleus submarinus]